MTVGGKTVLTACAAAVFALSVSACGSSTTSEGASSASSAISSVASGASSAASSAIEPSGEAEGTLASECGAIDAIMSGEPDADPAGTAAKLEEIKAKISTPDAELVGHLAEAYQGAAANPHDPALHEQVQSSATELGQACHSATTSAKPN